MSGSGMVVHKRMSFLASLVWGITAIVVTVIVCATSLAFYALGVVDDKAGSVMHIAENLVGDVPGMAQSLPHLQESLLGHRQPNYLSDLDVGITFSDSSRSKEYMTSVITVENTGSQTVTWLPMRVVVRDPEGSILSERVRHVATPISLDRDFPGPLMPGNTRRLTVGTFASEQDVTAEYEVTDIRLWTDAEVAGEVNRGPPSGEPLLTIVREGQPQHMN